MRVEFYLYICRKTQKNGALWALLSLEEWALISRKVRHSKLKLPPALFRLTKITTQPSDMMALKVLRIGILEVLK